MIQAILLIFFGMTIAEQAYVADAACSVKHSASNTYMTKEGGVAYVFVDGSWIEYPPEGGGGDSVFNSNGHIVHYSTYFE